MNPNIFMDAIGRAFGGYAQDQQTHFERDRVLQAQARQQALDQRNASDADFSRAFQLQQAGYLPAAQDFASRTTGPALALAQTIGGSPGAALAPGAQYKPQGPTITAPFTAGPQQFAFNYDRSPQGMMERRQNADQDARAKAAADAASAKEQSARKGAYTVLRASYKDNPLSQQPFDPSVDYGAELKDAQDLRKLQAQQPKQDQTQVLQGTDANGAPVYREFDRSKGQFVTGPLDLTPKAGPTAGASAQAQQARMLAATSEARLADQRMRAYEDKLLQGQASINPLEQSAGSLTTNLSDAHSAMGALMQAGSEFGLNKSDPQYAQYLRDAATIGRAEQMMSPRGGNETMVRANALLSRAGSGAMANTIDAARKARQALFGASGGIEQTLTPDQSQKLRQGVGRINAGEHTNVGAGGAASEKPPLSARVQQLKAAGYSKDAARAQLLHEGYDLTGGA